MNENVSNTLSTDSASPAPLWRRLAAMAYDTLIAIALLMTATAIALPLNQGEAFDSGNVGFQLYLVAVIAGFFLLFWRKGGQTLGMRALENQAGHGFRWPARLRPVNWCVHLQPCRP